MITGQDVIPLTLEQSWRSKSVLFQLVVTTYFTYVGTVQNTFLRK